MPRRILVYSDADPASATMQIRIFGPLAANGFEVTRVERGRARGREWAESCLREGFDALVVHRAIRKRCSLYGPLRAAARDLGIPVVYDTDDLLFRVSQEHPDFPVYQSKAVLALQALVDADYVVASTPTLAEQLSAFHAAVEVVPNRLPVVLWQATCVRRLAGARGNCSPPITIGYVGTRTHRPDLESLSDVLTELLDRYSGRVRFLSVGVPLPSRLKKHPAACVYFPPKNVARDYAEFAKFAAGLQIDVGIAPLLDNPFNRCKSDIKFQEYAALAVPGVYSHLPPYLHTVRDGKDGLLASTPDQWQSQLEKLVERPDVRHRLGAAAAQRMLQQWADQTSQTDWQQLIDRARSATSDGGRLRAEVMSPVFRDLLSYQIGLERKLKRTVEYQLGMGLQRLFRKLVA